MSDENTKQQTFEYVSNAEMKAKWGLKDNVSPQELPLDQINPGNNDWFARNQELEVFDRLRKKIQCITLLIVNLDHIGRLHLMKM